MDFQFIDITTYRGISSNAEHFYAKVGKPEYTQENIVVMQSCEPGTGVSFINGEELKYYPSKKEARKMWEKDNGYSESTFVLENKERMISDCMKEGTIRFPSIPAIIKRARETFPDSILCFSIRESRKEFVKYLLSLEKRDKKTLDKILNTIGII